MEQINAVGRRKAAIARVFMSYGTGKIVVNKRDYKDYFSVPHIQEKVTLPLQVVEAMGKYDLKVNVAGGGIKGQAEAVMLGIARALVKDNAENKPPLKALGIMTRDARKVERKKPGLRKARKKEQYSKR